MTSDTKFHFKMYPFDSVHGFDRTVALLANNFAINMSLMIEQHMLGEIIYFLPRRWGFSLRAKG